MQTPSGTLSLDLEEPQDAPSLDTSAQQRPEQQQQPSTGGDKNNAEDKNSTKRTDSGLLQPDHPIQRTLRFDLREEGSHTLAVSLSYYSSTITPSPSPASPAASAASSGRVRTFRKLYQFTARPCLNVRTKVSLPKAGPGIGGGGGGGTGKSGDAASGTAAALPILALEAQIDNLADGPIVLRNVTFAAKAAFKATGLNWDVFPLDREEDIRKEGLYSRCPILAPREVYQVAFLIEEVGGAPAPKKESLRDGRVMLGQLGLRWASEMGEEGFLTTGMLTKRR